MTTDEKRAYDKMYHEKNKNKRSLQRKEYYQKNKDELQAYGNEYNDKNKDKRREYMKEYYQKNKDKIDTRNKEYNEKNKDKISVTASEYYQKNKDVRRAYRKEYESERLKSDPLYKLIKTCRTRIRGYFKVRGILKSKHTFDMIGCTPTELRDHLQSQFTEGMTLENHGEWHIDHIIPLASANTDDDIIKLCHYTNLQPLWAEDNWSKGVKINLKKV